MKTVRLSAALLFTLAPLAAETAITIDSPMTPPAWALMERQLLEANSRAAERFAQKYVDSRGYLLLTPRWGTLDGPDDAIETFFNWTLLHTLGGDESALNLFKKAYDGHLLQYGELRTVKTEIAANGAYHQDFITQSDWFHTGEGMRGFLMQGLSTPKLDSYVTRMRRFAGLYMNEDPDAPNYDPKNKVIKSIWTGSKGPMMRKATTYDWVGDPVPGRFHLLHNPARTSKLLDLEQWYPRMLAHCDEYLDSVGDNSLNLAATILSLNAYALTHDKKYSDWTLEYVNAWKDRTEKTGGFIPSNVGLDGEPGGEYNGQWWKGTYGWNFTIFDGELEQTAHRNYFPVGPWPGFAHALMLTGDQSYIDVLRREMDLIYGAKKVENGRTLLPSMYGDPRGYKYDGKPEFYHYTPNLYIDRLTEIYLWSMNRKDLERIPKEGWIGFLEGSDTGYPEKALARDFASLRRNMERIRKDNTTADTRLADYLLNFNPVETDTLVNLMLGGYFSNGKIWTLHSRLRYFDPEKRRSGAPDDVAALVHSLSDDSVSVTLVNANQVEPRPVIVQAGAYGEHQFLEATVNGETTPVNDAVLKVYLAPGAGARLELKQKRYVNQPTLAQPWDRGWMVKQ